MCHPKSTHLLVTDCAQAKLLHHFHLLWDTTLMSQNSNKGTSPPVTVHPTAELSSNNQNKTYRSHRYWSGRELRMVPRRLTPPPWVVQMFQLEVMRNHLLLVLVKGNWQGSMQCFTLRKEQTKSGSFWWMNSFQFVLSKSWEMQTGLLR